MLLGCAGRGRDLPGIPLLLSLDEPERLNKLIELDLAWSGPRLATAPCGKKKKKKKKKKKNVALNQRGIFEPRSIDRAIRHGDVCHLSSFGGNGAK